MANEHRRPIISLARLDRSLAEPLHEQLYARLRHAILNGSLRPGDQLPSTRMLAEDLQVSRNTVLAAFDKLHSEGYLASRVGAGSFVASTLPDSTVTTQQTDRVFAGTRKRAVLLSKRGQAFANIDVSWAAKSALGTAFRVGAPAFDAFPYALWGRLSKSIWVGPSRSVVAYGDPAGYRPLRQAIADYLRTARGVNCDPARILVVDGSQQALDLAITVLMDPGDPAWIEEPGYLGARAALQARGAALFPVPVDDEGIDVAAGLSICSAPRLIYVTPSHQFPLGSVMSLRRRFDLLSVASQMRAWIVEDDYDSEFRYVGTPLQALQGLDLESRVIYTGTFSKVMFPSMRIGYIVVPDELSDAFLAARVVSGLHAPTPNQMVMAEFMAGGHLFRHLRRMRRIYLHRQLELVKAANAELGAFLEVSPSDAGMHLIAWMRGDDSDSDVVELAASAGIDVGALSRFYIGPCPRQGLLFGYSGVRPPMIWRAARELGAAFRGNGRLFGKATDRRCGD